MTLARRRCPDDLLLNRWAGRITLLALFVILLVTLFPYQFFFSGPAVARLRQPLWRWLSSAPNNIDDVVGNVLLFLPLGFGIASWARRRRIKDRIQLLAATLISLVLSFTIEALQNYLPGRDPSWGDVLTNVTGGALGALCSVRFSGPVLALVDGVRGRVLARIRWKLAVASGLLYSTVLSGILLPQERRASLSNWDASYPVLIGNEHTGDRPWRGSVELVEIASRALSAREVMMATQRGLSAVALKAMLSTIRLEGPGPYQDAFGMIPELRWHLSPPHDLRLTRTELGGGAWLQSSRPPSQLATTLGRTNQFTIHVVCASADAGQTGPARIFSYSLDPFHRNFTLGQEEDKLSIRLRTPFTGIDGTEPEINIPRVFSTPRRLDLIVTYDGYRLHSFVDGHRAEPSLELNPLAVTGSGSHTAVLKEARGFRVLFFVMIFAPLGFLLALAGSASGLERLSRIVFFSAGLVLPSLVFERAWIAVTCGVLNPYDLLWACGAIATGAALCECSFALLD
jgi:VanZ family protein